MSTGELRTATQEERAEAGRAALRLATGRPPEPPRQKGPSTPRRADADGWAYCLADLRATAEGKRLGRECGCDGHVLARRLGLAVEYVSPGAIDNPNKPRVAVLGRFVNLPGYRQIQVVAGLDGRNLNWTLAHECAHALNFPDERLCCQFADRFVKVEPDETAIGRAAKIRAELEQRARALSRGTPAGRRMASTGCILC